MLNNIIQIMSTIVVIVQNSGTTSVNGEYYYKKANVIPHGFDIVCKQNGWNTNELWNKLNGNSYYFEKENGAYIYYNKGDQRWWIDAKSGLGVYIADTDGSEDAKKYPPQDGYKVLQNAKLPLPTVIVKTRNNNNKEGNEML